MEPDETSIFKAIPRGLDRFRGEKQGEFEGAGIFDVKSALRQGEAPRGEGASGRGPEKCSSRSA